VSRGISVLPYHERLAPGEKGNEMILGEIRSDTFTGGGGGQRGMSRIDRTASQSVILWSGPSPS
jgi:hypothetical protein